MSAIASVIDALYQLVTFVLMQREAGPASREWRSPDRLDQGGSLYSLRHHRRSDPVAPTFFADRQCGAANLREI